MCSAGRTHNIKLLAEGCGRERHVFEHAIPDEVFG